MGTDSNNSGEFHKVELKTISIKEVVFEQASGEIDKRIDKAIREGLKLKGFVFKSDGEFQNFKYTKVKFHSVDNPKEIIYSVNDVLFLSWDSENASVRKDKDSISEFSNYVADLGTFTFL